jgi:hypothetical protein
MKKCRDIRQCKNCYIRLAEEVVTQLWVLHQVKSPQNDTHLQFGVFGAISEESEGKKTAG